MKRRDFLIRSLLGAAGAVALVHTSCQKNTNESDIKERNEKPDVSEFELNEATIDQLQQKMQSGELTSLQITELYLARIAAIDKAGPKLNSVIELNVDATKNAMQLDEERKAGKLRGAMHGIPVLLKDNIDTADGMQNTAGSLALEGNKPAKDAFLVEKLRQAGAVILGKTNLSEWANFRSTRSSSGWSSRGGQTHNPYITTHSPCGSSSGSGVAVAANLCAVAVGTETDGSIVCPASINGIVGLKPTVGLVSRSGIIPISETQDTAGPMARTVRDAAILLGAMVGVDANDKYTQQSDGKFLADYTLSLNTNALKGKRIGYDKATTNIHEGVDAAFNEALDTLKQCGAELVEVEFCQQIDKFAASEWDVLMYEFKDGLNKYLASANAKVKSLAELIQYNTEHADSIMPYFGQEIFTASEAKEGLDSKEYKKLLTNLLAARDFVSSLMSKHSLDALCGPSNGLAWSIDVVNGDHFSFGFSTTAAITGYPTITVPSGSWKNLPLGFTFITRPYTEADLLAMAYAFEQKSQKRYKPTFKLTVLD